LNLYKMQLIYSRKIFIFHYYRSVCMLDHVVSVNFNAPFFKELVCNTDRNKCALLVCILEWDQAYVYCTEIPQ
jgi:hypothetical protein